MRSSRKQGGFSLIELMLVVAISMILMGFSVPMIQSAMRNYTLNSTASNMTRMLQLARYTAIRQGTNASVRMTSVAGQDFFGVDANCSDALDNTEQIYLLQVGVTLSSTGPATTSMNFVTAPTAVVSPFVIAFNSRGSKAVSCADSTASAAPGLIYVTGWNNSNAVTVSGAGRARSWRYDGRAWH